MFLNDSRTKKHNKFHVCVTRVLTLIFKLFFVCFVFKIDLSKEIRLIAHHKMSFLSCCLENKFVSIVERSVVVVYILFSNLKTKFRLMQK